MKLLVLLLVVALAWTVRCDDDKKYDDDDDKHGPVSRVRDIGGYTHLVVTGAFKVVVKLNPNEPENIKITAAKRRIIRHVETEVRDDTLFIRMRGDFRTDSDVDIEIHVYNLVSIEANGASSVVVQGQMEGKVIRLTTSGACRINTRVQSEKLYSTINGAGVLDVNGKSRWASIRIVGSGRYNAGNLETEKTKVDIYGSADLNIWANRRIYGHIEGSAVVVYKGSYPKVEVDTDGSAVFRKQGTSASPYEQKVIGDIQALTKSFFANSLVDMS